MTIQEVINSGKYFHRPKHGEIVYEIRKNSLWCGTVNCWEEPEHYKFYEPEYSGFESFNAEDILANDWEIVID